MENLLLLNGIHQGAVRSVVWLLCFVIYLYLGSLGSILLRVGSEGGPESEVRRWVGVELTEYTEEGNG